MMYLCLDCGNIFDTPKSYTETHGFDFPPYEAWEGCPKCGGPYVKTMECDMCGRWITGEYIKLRDDTFVCSECYEINDITD